MNSQDNLVSVIITSYNYANFIGETINSILSQTHQNWELFICDDCSSDNSLDVIRSFHDPRITVIAFEKKQGACEAYNKAYSRCKGKYISSIDSDDYIAPDKFEKQVRFMENRPDIDICGTFVFEINEDGNLIHSTHEDWFNSAIDLNEPSNWIWQNRLCHSSVIMKKSMHDFVGDFNIDLIYSPDYEFWSRCLAKGAKFHVMTEKLTYYRFHGDNITHKNPIRSYWEKAFIAAKFLQPYFIQIARYDLAIKSINAFLNHELFPLERVARLNFLNLFVNPSSGLDILEKSLKANKSSEIVDAGAIHLLVILEALVLNYESMKRLREGNEWLSKQNESWQEIVKEKEAMIADQAAWIKKLQEGNERLDT